MAPDLVGPVASTSFLWKGLVCSVWRLITFGASQLGCIERGHVPSSLSLPYADKDHEIVIISILITHSQSHTCERGWVGVSSSG